MRQRKVEGMYPHVGHYVAHEKVIQPALQCDLRTAVLVLRTERAYCNKQKNSYSP
jgi:hypothetical protein